MQTRAVFDSVKPVFTGLSFVATGILLVATVFLTVFDLPWIAFLSGVLCAGVIGLIGRLSYAETELADVRASVRYIDDDLPVMVLYLDAQGIVRFHNQSYRLWLRARREAINGRPLRDVLGLTLYGQMRASVEAALAGEIRHETREIEGVGAPYSRLHVQFLPHVEPGGKVLGAFLVQTDLTQLAGPATSPDAPPAHAPAVAAPNGDTATDQDPNEDPEPERRIFVSTMTAELTDWADAGQRIRAALDNDEFCLYFQAIRPLGPDAEPGPFYEMLLRLREEEEGLMPPGAFLPLAEECGLTTELDKWVVRHVLDWAAERPERKAVRFALNLSAATLSQPDFADFVLGELSRCGAKGDALTFEIAERDARPRLRAASRLVKALREAGCRATLCGFGRDSGSFGLLKVLPVDYLKIDGDIVLGIGRGSHVDLIKMKAVARVAHATRRRTIAEFVENEETTEKLRANGVDYVQGFGVARPRALTDLD